MAIESGDDVYVDDGVIIGHVRRATTRDVIVFVEDEGDFTLPRDTVKATGNNAITLICRKLPIEMRAVIGHLHGETYDPDAE